MTIKKFSFFFQHISNPFLHATTGAIKKRNSWTRFLLSLWMYVTSVLFRSARRTFIWATTPNVFIRPSAAAKYADEYDHVCYYITGFPLEMCVEKQWIQSVFVHISHVWCDIKRRRKVEVVFLSLKQKESQLTTFQHKHSQDCVITDMQVRHHAAKATQKAYLTWNMPQLAFVPEK